MSLTKNRKFEKRTRNETAPKARRDFSVPADVPPVRRPSPTYPTFDCEEGEGGSAVPIPGLISKPTRSDQTEADRHYTSEDARGPAQWEPDLSAARREWTDDDVSATAMPGLIIGPDNTVSLSVEQPTASRGLCTSCELLKTCTFIKPESGVWRCEEYR
jgi:hypothetical protein